MRRPAGGDAGDDRLFAGGNNDIALGGGGRDKILTGKGGEESDKQMYAFEDNGGRRVAMRFDLTVPLARFVAQHETELGMPFKRYHIGPVWRGENTQRGRYRESSQAEEAPEVGESESESANS